MTWTQLASILLTTNWTYTDVAQGQYFRFRHSGYPGDGVYQVAQCEVQDDGTVNLYDSDALTLQPSTLADTLKLKIPPCLSNRRLAIRRLPTAPSIGDQLKSLLIDTAFKPQARSSVARSPSAWQVGIDVSDAVDPIPISQGSGGGMFSLIKTEAITSAANITFDGLNGDLDLMYQVCLAGYITNAGGQNSPIAIRPNGDTGSIYRGVLSLAGANIGANPTILCDQNFQSLGLLLGGDYYGSPSFLSGTFYLYASTGNYRLLQGQYAVTRPDNASFRAVIPTFSQWENRTDNITSLLLEFNNAANFQGFVSLGVLSK